MNLIFIPPKKKNIEIDGYYNPLKSSILSALFFFQESGMSNKSKPQLTPQQMLDLYNQALPTLGQTVSNSVIPQINTSLAMSGAMNNPIYTASGLNQLQEYAPGYQQAGANLANSQAQSQANLLNGAGANVASAANALQNQYNPAQAAANTQATNLVNSINLNGLSPGEQAAVERSLNQSNYATGNLGLDNATNAVSNAMNFGNALQAKRAALGSALQTATGVSGQQNTNFNPVNTAFNSGNVSNNFGLGTFNPTQANPNLTAPLQFATGLGQQVAQVSSAQKSSGGSYSEGAACYLTTACCEYKGLPDNCEQLTILRQFRDTFVPKEMIEEYYKIAPSIVTKIKNDKAKLSYVFKVINQCVQAIKNGNNTLALVMYKNMVKYINK